MSERTTRDLGTLRVNTGIQTLRLRERFERFDELGVDWRQLLRDYAEWRDVVSQSADRPAAIKMKAVRAVGGLELIIAVDTLAGPGEHGCLVETLAEVAVAQTLPVVVSVPMVTDAAAEGEIDRRPLCVGTFVLAAGGEPVDVTVIVDIGNSRSTVGVLEGREGVPADLERDLSLVPLGARGASLELRDTIAESTLELVAPEWPSEHQIVRYSARRGGRVREEARLFRDLSPARVGREARRLRFESGFLRGLRTGMSSPKRYLWSRDPADGAWFVHGGAGGAQPAALAGRLLRLLEREPGATLPRSQMMTLFAFELLYQTWVWVNSDEYLADRTDDRRRRIARVLVTFPSGMVAEEVAIYEARLQEALQALGRLVLTPSGEAGPELVPMVLDEGSAAQLAFVVDQASGGAESWSAWTRRFSAGGDRVRIGCLDIGGGSIDASAVEYRLDPQVIPFHLDCDLQYVDGVSRGGDDVLRTIIEQLLIPGLAQQMSCEVFELEALVYTEPLAGEDATTLAARIIQGLLYPLAIEVLRAAEGDREPLTVAVGAVPGVDGRLLAEIPRAFEAATPGRVYSPLQTATIEVTRKQLDAAIDRTIGGVLRPLSQALAEQRCDLILFAGRLSLLPAVVDIVQQALGWPTERLLPLHGSAGFARLARAIPGAGGVVDPKLAVLVGAAVSECARTNRTMNGVKYAVSRDGVRERGHFWGIVTPEERCFRHEHDLLFRPGAEETGRASSRQLTGAAFIGRRLTDRNDLEASPVYELAPRVPGFGRHDVRFRLLRDPEAGEERIALSAGGERCDATNGPVCFRLKTIFDDEYWLDGKLRDSGTPGMRSDR